MFLVFFFFSIFFFSASSFSSFNDHPYHRQSSIVNPHPFTYILNPGQTICPSQIYLFIYVHSSPSNYQRRNLIRETWAKQSLFPETRLLFMMGKVDDESVMKAVQYEYELYQDIVQQDFFDSYKNLTYKGLMALKWISTYCSQANYVLKVDDDIMVNTFTLINHLKYLDKHEHRMQKIQGRIFCLLWQAMEVMRDSTSKWYVSREEFPLNTFPPYCSGSAYIMTGDMPAKMFDVSRYIPFFWVDDYYITGAIASAVNVTYVQLGSMYTILEDLAHTRFMSQKSFYTIMFGHLPSSMNEMYEIWQRILLIGTSRFSKSFSLYSFAWDGTIFHSQPPKFVSP